MTRSAIVTAADGGWVNSQVIRAMAASHKAAGFTRRTEAFYGVQAV